MSVERMSSLHFILVRLVCKELLKISEAASHASQHLDPSVLSLPADSLKDSSRLPHTGTHASGGGTRDESLRESGGWASIEYVSRGIRCTCTLDPREINDSM